MDGSTAIATQNDNVYASYGAKVGQAGLFLSFKNGDFNYGQNGDCLPLGTRLAANMAGLRVGWKRWFGGQVTDDMLELLTDQRPVAPRNTLGDNDQALWERDEKTKVPRDPWQFTNELLLADGEGQQYVFATASKGGIGAIGRLCKDYGKLYRQKPGMVPIVELATDFYMHKEYGKTYFPIFNLVDWVAEDELSIPGASAEEAVTAAPPAPVAAAPAAAPASRKTRF